MIQKISIFTYLWQNNLRNLIVDFIAAFTFNILINDSIFIEKYGKMILDLKQLSIINLRRTSYLPTE
ncbi:hypothetical protein CVT91_02950 [Candidatus Atribacteria bacterium HGW-Atribacteria-1]|nr:MAG: hypothetical protein CVT91_02950 [Candidatus Atribacteria bacterium HGW-Atribacteria-1]